MNKIEKYRQEGMTDELAILANHLLHTLRSSARIIKTYNQYVYGYPNTKYTRTLSNIISLAEDGTHD